MLQDNASLVEGVLLTLEVYDSGALNIMCKVLWYHHSSKNLKKLIEDIGACGGASNLRTGVLTYMQGPKLAVSRVLDRLPRPPFDESV